MDGWLSKIMYLCHPYVLELMQAKRKDPSRVAGDLVHDSAKCLACLLGLDPDGGLALKSGQVVYRAASKKEGKGQTTIGPPRT
jgi:hypothetical protein